MREWPSEIEKASGVLEAFSIEKLQSSLEKAGVSNSVIKEVLRRIQKDLPKKMTTQQLNKLVLRQLREHSLTMADRYKLKNAIMRMGPSGFPFEKFVASLLTKKGYRCLTNQIYKGACIQHEVDVYAENSKEHAWIECKYHNQRGIRTDVKVTLYCYARFLDLKNASANKEHQFWLITNTKFTLDAETYAGCVNLPIIGWNFPKHNSIQMWIETTGEYPISCLENLTSSMRKELFQMDIATVPQLMAATNALKRLRLHPNKLARLQAEMKELVESCVPDFNFPLQAPSSSS